MQLPEILRQIDSLKKDGERITSTPEAEKVFWDKFRLEFNYNSNHIEGNTLTYGHTQLLLIFDKIGGDYTGREIEEMKAHDLALKIIEEAAADEGHILTEKLIREINKLILVRPYYKEAITPEGQPTSRLIKPGGYKEYPNSVRLENGEIFNYASPGETPALMGDLISWYREETDKNELHPVQIAALLHYRFVKIHPFDDSNGRTSRLLMNYVLLRNGYSPLVIESADKKNYLTALNKADTGDLESFVEYIIGKALRWQTLYLDALKGNSIEEEDDFDKEVELMKRKMKTFNDKIEHTLSKNTFQNISKTAILPLFTKALNEIKKFDDFFLESKVNLSSGGRGGWYDIKKDSLPIIFDDIAKDYDKKITRLTLAILHSKLRKSDLVGFSYKTQIEFNLSEYYYEISTSIETQDIRKYYHEELSLKEINEIVKQLAKKELEEIKSIT